jgi:hypothetical protein
MRSISLISTKDHLVWLVLADNIGDESSISDITPGLVANGSNLIAYNVIAFGVEGSVNAFMSTSDTTWEHWGDYTYPMIESKFNDTPGIDSMFGHVATSDNTLFIGIIPKDDSVSSSYIDYTNQVASPEELIQLQQEANTSFQVAKICQQVDLVRDLTTFEKLEEIDPTISDFDITII